LLIVKKNQFNYVYHPFTGNSSKFEDVLQFGKLYDNHYSNIINSLDKIIDIKYLITEQNDKTIHNKLIELHESSEKIMLFDSIFGNQDFFKNFNINQTDIIEAKKTYKSLIKYYKKIIENDYICIHIRCGDIVNDKSRYLSIDYFIEKYNYLLSIMPELNNIPVYIITEQNFADDNVLYEKIKNCNIIKTDEMTSFYYLVNCKYFIASRSGFSNLAYILGNMKVINPPFDWNCYWDNVID
jgi:hypothetical protein